MHRRWSVAALVVALGLLLAACGGGSKSSSSGGGGSSKGTVRIGYVDFSEQAILAQIYGQVLQKAGWTVSYQKYATRELADPALFAGKQDMLIEYAGSDLTYLKGTPSPDAAKTLTALTSALAAKQVKVFQQAPMSDQQAITVTQVTAGKYHLKTLSDLAKVAPQLIFGGPPECENRQTCYKGLQATYGIKFKQFKGLAQGSIKYQALLKDQIQVALSFSTDGIIAKQHLVVLQDDKKLFPPDHAVPIARQDFAGKAGPEFSSTVDKVSAAITTDEITALNAKVDIDQEDPDKVATDWLKQKSLI